MGGPRGLQNGRLLKRTRTTLAPVLADTKKKGKFCLQKTAV